MTNKPDIEGRIRLRYPELSPALIQRYVQAAAEAFRDARVQTYLPILIERRVYDALRGTEYRLPSEMDGLVNTH